MKANLNKKGTAFVPKFIQDYKVLKKVVQELKEQGKRIVLTQGVYDLIHEGHALYLAKARSYGDVLFVGVDSDLLTKKRKGPSRPIVPEKERLNMLLHLRHVDIVTLREIKHGLGGLIQLINPDVLIVSSSTKDFPKKDVAMYKKHAKEIIMLPPQATTSSTARIRTLTIEGAENLAREINKLTQDFLEKIKNS
jgi:D-beta-D-heptose 7-phosphate kinase/D-beta-D-heptose 1-phosphate adenosyltransferase